MLGFAAHIVAIGAFVAASSACSSSREPEEPNIGNYSWNYDKQSIYCYTFFLAKMLQTIYVYFIPFFRFQFSYSTDHQINHPNGNNKCFNSRTNDR